MYQFEKVSQLGTGQKKLDINQCSEQGSNTKELRISWKTKLEIVSPGM